MAKNDSPPFQLSIKTGFDFEKCYSNWFLQNAKRLEVTNSGQDVKGFIYMPMKQKREICIFWQSSLLENGIASFYNR